MPSEWNNFVKQIYAEGKAKSGGYSFSQALKDASKRKHEMRGGDSTPAPAELAPAEVQAEVAPIANKVGGKSKHRKSSKKVSKSARKSAKRGRK